MKNLKTLGLLAAGNSKSTFKKFNSEDLIGCAPEFVVRHIDNWLIRFSSLGITPFAVKDNAKYLSYACGTDDGNAILVVTRPKGGNNEYKKSLDKHGAYFRSLVFFCSSEKSANLASKICLNTVSGAKSVENISIELYSDVFYKFVAIKKSQPFLEGYEPYSPHSLPDNPNLNIKLDHIVQNVDSSLYKELCNMFDWLGFEATFGGADTVEFSTRAYSPSKGIFDRIPFFAINTSANSLSQINVGINENNGPFIQHLALHVNNWSKGAKIMTRIGMPVMGLERRGDMGEYYKASEPLFHDIFPKNNFEDFRATGGLFDSECQESERSLGLLQSFFRTLDSVDKGEKGKLTCFLELIERSAHALSSEELKQIDNLKGRCAGFGKGNFGELAADVHTHSIELGVKTAL